MSWFAALAACEARGMRLPEPRTPQIEVKLLPYITQSLWIGLTDHFKERQWFWHSNKDPLSWTHWARGRPAQWDPQKNCAIVSKNGRWRDMKCHSSKNISYVCEMWPESINGEEAKSNYFSHTHQGNLTWHTAKVLCEARCMRLPEPRTKELLARMMDHIQGSRPVWIGLRYTRNKQGWYWQSGEKLTGEMENHWVSNEQPNIEYKSCAKMLITPSFPFVNAPCEVAEPFADRYVCETVPDLHAGGCISSALVAPKFSQRPTYLALDQPMTQPEAQAFCESEGRKLPMPKHYLQNELLIWDSHTQDDFFLGVKKAPNVRERWVWDDNTVVGWANWLNPSVPGARGLSVDRNETDQCVKMLKSPARGDALRGKWAGADCDDVAGTVVCVNIRHINETGWPLYFHGLHTRRLTWHAARALCAARGMRLPEPRTRHFTDNLAPYVTQPMWIGLHDESGQGDWRWDASGAAVHWTNWAAKGPRSGGGRRCAVMTRKGRRFRWQSRRCYGVTGSKYACEMTQADAKRVPVEFNMN